MLRHFLSFTGTVSVISSEPLYKEDNVRFTSIPLKPCVDRPFYFNSSVFNHIKVNFFYIDISEIYNSLKAKCLAIKSVSVD